MHWRLNVCLLALMGFSSFVPLRALAIDDHKFGAEAAPYCPTLPDGSGYEWEWIFRIDWGHCVGRVAKTHKEAFDFGIARLYGVMPPGVIEPESAFVRFGCVGGTLVKWYTANVRLGPEVLEYRTFTLLNEERMSYLSVRVYAESELQMEERL